MCRISAFNDLNDAVAELKRYNKIGSHGHISERIYEILSCYIGKTYGVHKSIIGILQVYGFSNTPEFQDLLHICDEYGYQSYSRDISSTLRSVLHNKAEKSPGTIIELYSNLYDVFIKYDMFKDKKWITAMENGELNLVSPIDDITRTMAAYMSVRLNFR
jgi:hypothetical protein